jgi:GT2 family glycosyltransferase
VGELALAKERSESVTGCKAGKIGVITVTFNSADVLPDFFDSLAAQTHPDFTVYVVDNASKDRTLELCRGRSDLPLVLISNDANLGVAEGNNQGIRAALQAGCEYVLLLNNDTVFDNNLFLQLRDGILNYGCAMTTPKIYYYDDPKRIWAAGGHFQPWLGYRTQHYGMGEEDSGQFDVPRSITYSPTCCVLIHRTVFERIGLMDPAYFVYSDDVDFMFRAAKAGYKMMYLPGCSLLHKVHSLTGGATSAFTVRYCTRNRVYFARKNLSRTSAAFWVAMYRIYLFARYVLKIDKESVWKLKQMAAREGDALGITGQEGLELR